MTRRIWNCQEPEAVAAHFWSIAEKRSDGCWLWIASKDHGGYGRYKVNGVAVRAHRFAFELVNGAIPAGLIVCHRCDVPACVNPAHLFLGSHADNAKDKVQKGRVRPVRGSACPLAKLTEAQVFELRQRRANGAGVNYLARDYGVSPTTISRIVNGKNWRHLAEAEASDSPDG